MSGVGPAAEEAAKLLQAAEQWARTRGAALLADEHLATGSAACTVCPLCSVVSAARAVKPETVRHLLEAAGSLVAALATVVPTPDEGPAPRPGVQRIDLDAGGPACP